MGVNSLPWYYVPVTGGPGDTVLMTGEEWHHCFHVLRMTAGESLIMFDGRGHCMEGIIRSGSKQEGLIEVTEDRKSAFQVRRSCRISIAFALTKNIDRTEFAVEKLVELGVDEISFLDCDHAERTNIRMDRMEKIAISAAKQSRKMWLPSLRSPIAPSLLIARFTEEQPGTMIFCCHLDPSSTPLVENYLPRHDVLLLIGPEGGFTNEETEQMSMRGAKMVTLGPHRLRVETAAITACAAIHIFNDLKTNS